jgi:hypothetical protein
VDFASPLLMPLPWKRMFIHSDVFPVVYWTSLSIKDEGSVDLFVGYIAQRYETHKRTDQPLS